MSEEKQIEDMRKDLIEIFDEEYEKRRLITPQNTAEKMTAKGYRKQSEGEWIEKLHFNFEGGCSGANYECSNCHFDDIYDLDDMNYCPRCGAKMKGGADNE